MVTRRVPPDHISAALVSIASATVLSLACVGGDVARAELRNDSNRTYVVRPCQRDAIDLLLLRGQCASRGPAHRMEPGSSYTVDVTVGVKTWFSVSATDGSELGCLPVEVAAANTSNNNVATTEIRDSFQECP